MEGPNGMFKIGKKDRDGRQVRIEHTGKYTRASRTGGISVRAEKKIGAINLTANSSKGLRASTRISNGMRAALQNGRFQLIGRWRSGPIAWNLSKSGVSASFKNKAGSFNFLKPQYSSFKFAGIHLRGRKAAQIQLLYILVVFFIFILQSLIRLFLFCLWLVYLVIYLFFALLIGFVRGVRGA